MAGTDRSRGADPGGEAGPAIVLIEPQLGDNIGATARAMLNCDLHDLRLVRPRDGWPNPAAVAMASGAVSVLERARVHETTLDAVLDLELVLATTARERDQAKTVLTPRAAALHLRQHVRNGGRAGILFGPERAGLVNDDIASADLVINVPLNPGFSSLNLSQAVLLIGYEWYQTSQSGIEPRHWGASPPATVAEQEFFFGRLETELEAAGFLFPTHLAPTIRRNLRGMFKRTALTAQEVRTLHGVLSALIKPRS